MSGTTVMPDQFQTFGELLKYLRRREGLTQSELSIAVGYSDTQISRLEQNLRVPDAATLTALFLPALQIDSQPHWAEQMLSLAAKARTKNARIESELLEVRLLGKFDVRYGGKPITISARPAQSLFAYLVLKTGTSHRREKLAGMLWPDSLEETARDNLRHALWRVRKAFGTVSSTPFFYTDDLSIRFETSAEYWIDTAALEKLGENAPADELIAVLSEYQGELLPGFYDEWVVLEREHLFSIFEHHMARLMSLLQNENRWLDILDYGERWIKLGEKPEPAYRALMAAHAAKGDMAKVAATYERCVKSLSQYGLEPSEQTSAVYENIKAGKAKFTKRLAISTFVEAPKPDAVLHTNLPIPLTSFIGREKEVKEIVQIVGKNRLLTLTGTGGIGKTRIAIESANKVLHHFKDGVWWVDLVGLNDPSLLPQAMAQVVNVTEIPNQSMTERLIEHFRSKQALLVLDNCEHLISACAQLANRLLSTCKELKILTTSREALDILGETVWLVPSLSLPDIQKPIPARLLSDFESIQLFADRASLVHPAFNLSDQNANAVVRICYRLSGMPLAIELAAARVKMMSIEEIAKHLDERFDLLTSGSGTVLRRHQTLRATIDWSYDLLSTLEQIFFQRLSVFMDGFTLMAAKEITVGGDILGSQVLDLLGQLINKSLVSMDTHSGHSTVETRYRMLETIREYGIQKLDESGETEEVRDRHLAYFMRLAEQAQPEIFLSSQVAWLDLLEIELDNLQAAMDWSITSEQVSRQEAGLRLAASLAWFWERSYKREATVQLKRMLVKMDAIEVSPVHTMMFSAVGFLYWSTGEFKEARAYLEKAITTGRNFGKSLDLAWAHNYLGASALAQGDQETAQLMLEEAFELAMELGPAGKHVVGWALAFLGDILFSNHDLAKAESMYEMSILALGEIGNLNLKAYPLRRLGYLALYHDDLKSAEKYFKDSLVLNTQLKHQVGITSSVAAFAGLAVAEKHYVRSAKLLGAVEAILEATAQVMLPSDHFEFKRNIKVLRQQLDSKIINSAWNEGRAMQLEQVLAFTLATEKNKRS